MRPEADRLETLAQSVAQQEIFRKQLQLAGLDLRKIQDVVDEPEQGFAGTFHGGEIIALLPGERGVQRQLGHADDAVHRRADFVAHVGEKVALGAVGGFGGFLGDLHRFVKAHLGDGGGGAVREGGKKFDVLGRVFPRFFVQRVEHAQRPAFGQQWHADISPETGVGQHLVGMEWVFANVTDDHRLATINDPAGGAALSPDPFGTQVGFLPGNRGGTRRKRLFICVP